jgi:hypothetical protein
MLVPVIDIYTIVTMPLQNLGVLVKTVISPHDKASDWLVVLQSQSWLQLFKQAFFHINHKQTCQEARRCKKIVI